MERKQKHFGTEHVKAQALSVPVMYTVISVSIFFLQLTFNEDMACMGTGFQ